MQAKLPDINAAIVRYRSHALDCFKQEDSFGASMALSTINALLAAADYNVRVSTIEYEQLTREKSFAYCKKCKKNIPLHEVKYITILLPQDRQILLGQKTQKIWVCPDCKNDNIVNQTKFKHVRLENPSYLGVIPDPPPRKMGVAERSYFYSEFRPWFGLAITELEHKIGKYRADYAAQQSDEMQTMEKEIE